MEPLLIVILSGFVLAMFIDLSIKCMKRSKGIAGKGEKIYTIKKYIPYLQVKNIAFFIIAVWSAYSYAKVDEKDYVYAVHGVVEFFNHQDIFMRWVYALYLITICVMFINFTLSLFLQDEIYTEGIITLKGKFIYFDNIKNVKCRKSFLWYKTKIDIYFDGKRIDTIKVHNSEVDKVISIIDSNINNRLIEDFLIIK